MVINIKNEISESSSNPSEAVCIHLVLMLFGKSTNYPPPAMDIAGLIGLSNHGNQTRTTFFFFFFKLVIIIMSRRQRGYP